MQIKQKKSFLDKLTGSGEIEEDMYDDGNQSPAYINEDRRNTENRQINRTPMETEEEWVEEETEGDEDGDGQLTIDVFQTENDIVIKSTIAGVKPEDLDVSISNDMLTIKGERRKEETIREDEYYYQECYWGSFSRSIVLPVEVIAEKIEATLKNGILTVKLPKADVKKTKRIQVRGF